MTEGAAPVGRRERKKAATRKSIAETALRLFLERGYDRVGVRDVAEEADVSTTTLFKHFSGKVDLVFDREGDVEASLLAAVRERPPGQSIPAALREHALSGLVDTVREPEFRRFLELVESTTPLREHHRRMWMRHQDSLARAIAEDGGMPPDDPTCAAMAHFALEASNLALSAPDPEVAVRRAFDLIEHGWDATGG